MNLKIVTIKEFKLKPEKGHVCMMFTNQKSCSSGQSWPSSLYST
jgi:hypothetical protein